MIKLFFLEIITKSRAGRTPDGTVRVKTLSLVWRQVIFNIYRKIAILGVAFSGEAYPNNTRYRAFDYFSFKG